VWGLSFFKVILTTIVTADKNDGVVVDFFLFEEGDDFTELAVDHVHEGGVDFGVLISSLARFPWLVFEELPRGIVLIDSPETMWGSPREVAEEGGFVVLFDELERFLENLILRVGFSLVEAFTIVSGKGDFFTVTDEVAGIKSMRVDLVVVAKEFIEAVLFWNSRGAATTDAPFSKSSGGVSLGLEHAGKGGLIGSNGGGAAVVPH